MVFTSFVSLVSLRKNTCVTRQNPHNPREIHPNGDLLIHRLRGPPKGDVFEENSRTSVAAGGVCALSAGEGSRKA